VWLWQSGLIRSWGDLECPCVPLCCADKLGRPDAWRAAWQAGNGYSILEKQVSAGHEALDRGAKIMHELATLEQEYAKGLAKVARSLAASMKDELPYAPTLPWRGRGSALAHGAATGADGWRPNADRSNPCGSSCARSWRCTPNCTRSPPPRSRPTLLSSCNRRAIHTLNTTRR